MENEFAASRQAQSIDRLAMDDDRLLTTQKNLLRGPTRFR